MALVTLQRSPTLCAASSASTTTADAGEDLGSETDQKNNQSLSESFFMVKGAALFLQQGSSAEDPETPCHHKHAGDLPEHLRNMIKILRSEDHIKLAVRLERGWSDRIRYMVVVYTSGLQDTEESILLGMELDGDSKSCSVGLVLPLWSDANIHLDGDGGFSVNTAGRTHVFKPVSVQAMWSALQILHKACEVSRRCNYFPGGIALTWTGFYESCITSEQSCVNEWNVMSDLESRPETPSMFMDRPTERERTESLIRAKLRGIVTFQDLENVTSKEIRNELEQHMSCSLTEYKEFIDNEMLLILGQMDKPTLIFDHLYLGSEWNASNLEELRECGVGYVLNVTREIDNFFPGIFSYHNVRVFDEETTDLLAYWSESYNFIAKAKKSHSKCLVHCKMGVSRSASTVIAYAMKEYGWSLEKAYSFVKQKRSVAQPKAGFMRQLAEYEGILDASNQRHSRLWRPGADEDAPDEPSGRRCCPGLGGGRGEEEEEEEEEEEWGACGASSSPRPRRRRRGNRCGGGPEVEPLDPLNYNYYFRRLSDSALDSEPSTPVRGPPLLGMERVYIEIEDVERDALLEDAPLPPPPPPSATGHLALPPGAAAQTCCRGDPLEDMRQRLEFSTLEEEDEEEAKKEEEEMAALALGGGGAGRREAGRLGLANLNTNNSNRLAAKRSCPSTFDDSASTRSPFKVKPSYQSCEDCRRLPQGRRCDRPAGGRAHRHHPARHGGNIPTISIDPPGTHFASTPELSAGTGPATTISCSLGAPGGCPEAPSQIPLSPLGFKDTEEDMEENAQGEPALRAGPFTQLPSVPPHGEVEPSGGEEKQQRARHQGRGLPSGLDLGAGPVALAMDGRLP